MEKKLNIIKNIQEIYGGVRGAVFNGDIGERSYIVMPWWNGLKVRPRPLHNSGPPEQTKQ